MTSTQERWHSYRWIWGFFSLIDWIEKYIKLAAGDNSVCTCFTLLFLQNHQRPDFLGILSFTQASSVACQSQ